MLHSHCCLPVFGQNTSQDFNSLNHISDVWWSTLWSIASISSKNIKTNCWSVNNNMMSLHSACGLWFDLRTQGVVEIKGQWPNRWHCDISHWSVPHLQIAEPDFKSHAYSRHFELLLDKVASTDSGGNQRIPRSCSKAISTEHRQPRMANSSLIKLPRRKQFRKGSTFVSLLFKLNYLLLS